MFRIVFRPIGSIIVVGRSQPIDAFEPLQKDSAASASLQMYLDAFARLAEHDTYAQTMFSDLRKRYPEDPLIRLHADRTERADFGVIIRMLQK